VYLSHWCVPVFKGRAIASLKSLCLQGDGSLDMGAVMSTGMHATGYACTTPLPYRSVLGGLPMHANVHANVCEKGAAEGCVQRYQG
jgi:hypothetical protein